ncbi:MAG: cobalamin-dependent protein [Clostridia bacterium]|nr:cobalamin-dependent protein [Clostridia bacterium]
MKKKFYFIQPNTLLGNSIYFPYAVGVLSSYALQFEDVSEKYELAGIIFKEDTEKEVMSSIIDPEIVGFSNYFWNYEYNLEQAKNIKEKYPECVIIFGGHQVSRDSDFLLKYPFIDILIFGEGEIPFTRILRTLDKGESLGNIPNISFRNGNGEIIKTEDKAEGVENYPSPYLTGIFDKLLNVPEGMEFNAQLETNRGCPYHCSFCDWCDYDLPMRQFPMERVKKDLEWISGHKISYCMCVDSNFGLFERDEEITEFAVSLKKKNGFPDKFGACFAKNKTDRIFTINKMFNDVGMSKGVSLAFQSMSETVLENISRKNMNKDKLSEQLELYHKAGIPTYTELILGLPGETLKSFSEGICELLERGQHDSINVFRCEVYPNSTLSNKDYMKKFGIKTAINKLNINHCAISNAVFSGGLEYIIETSTMSADDLVKATVFSACIQSVHCHGLLQCFAIYLHNAMGVPYYNFYNSFINYFSDREGVIGDTIRRISRCIESTADGEADLSYINREFGDITWPYEEAMLLDYIYKLDDFYKEAEEFIKDFGIEENVMNELMSYQKNLIVTPFDNDVKATYSYNWKEYFYNILANKETKLDKKETTLRFFADDVPSDWENYAKKIIWYGRRNKKTIRTVESI